MIRGGGEVSQKVIFDDQGGKGVQTPPKKHDIINEQPLIYILASSASNTGSIHNPSVGSSLTSRTETRAGNE